MSVEARLETLRIYLAACERREIPAIAACFEPRAKVVDPLGKQNGLGAIRRYFTSIYKELAKLSFETGPVCWCGPSCAVSWKGTGVRHDGSSIFYEGIDIFTFGPTNRIRELGAFWVPDDLLGSDGGAG
jgi:hypothetical protein